MFVPSEATTVNVVVVAEPTSSAVPVNVPLELNVKPLGTEEPAFNDKVTA